MTEVPPQPVADEILGNHPWNTMTRSIAALTLVVRDYDEAIRFFTDALRFILLEDRPLGGGSAGCV